jgi:NADH-quinone oxidoreductase subunit F
MFSDSNELEKYRIKTLQAKEKTANDIQFFVCCGTACSAAGARKVAEKFKEEIEQLKIAAKVQPIQKSTGCHGFCEKGPLVTIKPSDTFYVRVTVEDVPEIIRAAMKGEIVERLLYSKEHLHELEIPFYKKQERLILSMNPLIDPLSFDDYMAVDGFKALEEALRKEPLEIINEIKKSGLRGRGGGGFYTGTKWELCHKQGGGVKYIICNADEGDPGAYMDRSVLEGNPYLILEGMMIGAFAVGASEGWIYVRKEYPLAVQHVTAALQFMREAGLLGKNILGTGFSFDIKIVQGAGAFVCGEETALIASVEGRRGTPRQRPPFPVERGLFGKPTVINNVETWANVPLIVKNGAGWFASMGTEISRGTKIFSLVGKVKNTGLVEVPMGITLKEIIYDIGGGLAPQRNFKAVQTGGPSGGCLPVSLLDNPIDYESLVKAGSMMGSGGMIVMDDHTCMVDVAKYFLAFLQDESCGKCFSCRKGTQKLLEIVADISEGRGKPEDLETLMDLAEVVKDASLCGLGQTAPNPVLATLRYFKQEYEDHILRKRCEAAVCKEIVSSPCQHICPIDTKASTYIALTAQKRYEEAVEVIKMDNPLCASVARVCHHPCETYCRAGEGGEPVSIRGLKRFLTDMGTAQGWFTQAPKVPKSGKRAAIVGAGPAGLACAFLLSQKGHRVTLFEKDEKLGGMLQYGVPEYRLPKAVVKQDVDFILSSGMDVRTGKALGKDFSLDDLFKEGFDAVFLGLGAHKSQKLGIPGEEAPGVEDGLKVLRTCNEGRAFPFGERVGVLGGGHAAVDAARSAVRSRNVKEVTLFYRRTLEEMPAFRDPEDVHAAIAEGVKIIFLAAPKAIQVEGGKLKGLVLAKMKLGDIDASGRRKPEPIPNADFFVELDTLVVSIGEKCDTDLLKPMGIETHKNGILKVLEDTLATSREGVFAGGDIAMGPSSVIQSIGQGKAAAQSMDQYLKGQAVTREYTLTRPPFYMPPIELTEEEISDNRRMKTPTVPVANRQYNIQEVEISFSEAEAVREARRCLRCELETCEGKEFIKSLEPRAKEA